jgi:peptidoglycan/LPS O-acetylase OafA/YrhL
MHTVQKRRTNWKQRRVALIICVAAAMLLASIDVADSHDSRLGQIARMLLALVMLVFGVYEFVKPDAPKSH